jgi:hypothetical protein
MPNRKMIRLAGILYLLVIVTGIFSELAVRQRLRIPGDAMQTASLIMQHERLFRWGVVADLLNFVLGIPILVILYRAFRLSYPLVATTAFSFAMVQTGVNAINMIFQLAPLNFLSGDAYLQGFTSEQLPALSLVSLQLQAQGYGIGLFFFGVYCMLVSYILLAGKYVPSLLGWLYGLAGVLYIVNTLILFLDHDFNNPWFIWMMLPIFFAELGLALWLLFKGLRSPADMFIKD